MEDIEDNSSSRMRPPIHKGEEIPFEEVDVVTDWNASAWKAIQARDAKALNTQSLADSLALSPTHMLESVLKVCIYEQQDEELQELIRAELKKRPDIPSDTDTPQ